MSITAAPTHAPVGVPFNVEFDANALVLGPCSVSAAGTLVSGDAPAAAGEVEVTLTEASAAASLELDCGEASDSVTVFAWEYGTLAWTDPLQAGSAATLTIPTTPTALTLSCDLTLTPVRSGVTGTNTTVTTSPNPSVTVAESVTVSGACFARPSSSRVGPGKDVAPFVVQATPVVRSVTLELDSVADSVTFSVNVDGAASCALSGGATTAAAQVGDHFEVTLLPADVAGTETVAVTCGSADVPAKTASSESYVVRNGDVDDQAKLNATAGDSVAIVLGNVGPFAFTTVASSTLRHVTGNLDVGCGGGTTLPSVNLPALSTVGGYLRVADCDAVGFFMSLPLLREVEGSLTVMDHANLATLGLPELRRVGGSMTVSGNGALESVRANLLRDVVGSFSIGGALPESANPLLDTVELGGLLTVGGTLLVQNNPQLTCGEIEQFCDATCGGKSISNNSGGPCSCP